VTEPVDYMPVGERIAIYRRRRGLSQLALANLIGRSEAWLSQVERGIRHADRLSVIIRLAQVLKVTVEDLVGQPLSLAPNGGVEYRAIPALRAALTDYEMFPRRSALPCPMAWSGICRVCNATSTRRTASTRPPTTKRPACCSPGSSATPSAQPMS
jgi:transcriptional regulator with XRE-family HTH domain